MNAKGAHAESFEKLQATAHHGPAWTAAIANGFDMSLVELSLAKTPWNRLLGHDDAQAFATRLRTAVEQQHPKSQRHDL